MTSSVWLRDLSSWSVQIAALVAAGGALAWALRLRASRAMLVFWQTLLAICLVLPLCQVRRPAKTPLEFLAHRGAVATTLPARAPSAAAGWTRLPDVALAIVGAGIVARGAWLLLGLLALRRMRRQAAPLLPDAEPFLSAQRRLGVAAEFYASRATTTPVTFGFRRPAVVLPEAVLALDAEAQRAVAYHELAHVARRDWGFLIVEEAVRAVLWFHPAVWWLVARIHLTREEVVDRTVVELTESRERYVEVLLAVARFATRPKLVPATLFLRRSLLRARVAELLKETNMSKRRLLSSLAVSAVVLLAVTQGAVRLFPLEAHAAEPRGGAPVQVTQGGDKLLHSSPIEYPARALRKGVEGDVQLAVEIDERGEVVDARVVSGPQELRAAALESVLRWHFAATAPASRDVVIHFQLPEAGSGERNAEFKGEGYAIARTAEGGEVAVKRRVSPENAEHLLKERMEQLQAGNLSPEDETKLKRQVEELNRMIEKMRALDGRLGGVRTERVSEDAVNSILGSLNLHVGDPMTPDMAGRVLEAVRAYDEHFRAGFERDKEGRLVLLIIAP